MQPDSNSFQIFSIKWLDPILGLVRERQFEEAFGLATYYPATPGRHLLQVVSSLGQYALNLETDSLVKEYLKEGESVARRIKIDDSQSLHDFAQLAGEVSPRLLESAFWAALKHKLPHLAHLCLAARHSTDEINVNGSAVSWLEVAHCASAADVGELVELSLRSFFAIESPAESTIRGGTFSAKQLLNLLIEVGLTLSPERSWELIAEISNLDLELTKDEIEKLKSSSNSFPPELQVRLNAGIVRQEIYNLARTAAVYQKAVVHLEEIIETFDQLTFPAARFEELLTECAEIETLVEHVSALSDDEKLTHRIKNICEWLSPYFRAFVEIHNRWHEVHDCFGLRRQDYPNRDFRRELYFLEDLNKIAPRAAILRRAGAEVLTDLARPVVWLADFRQQVRSLTDDVMVSAVVSEQFSKSGQEILRDTSSYESLLKPLQDYQQNEAVVRQAVSFLSASLSKTSLELQKSQRPNFSVGESLLAAAPAARMLERHVSIPQSASMPRSSRIKLGTPRAPRTRPIERYTSIQFPERCRKDQKVELRIKLTRKVPTFTRVLHQLKLRVGAAVRTVDLVIIVTAPGFAVRQPKQRMVMPIDDDSSEVVFELYAAANGPQVVEIEFFYESSRVGHVLVQSHVSYGFDRRAGKNVVMFKDPVKSLDGKPTVRKHILHVTWMNKTGELHYVFPDVDEAGPWTNDAPDLKSGIEESLLDLNAFLTEAVSTPFFSKKSWDSTLLNLKGQGKFLFDTLVPSAVADQIKLWAKDSMLAISTNEQWIPWELMFDGEEFLGRKHILTRYPRFNDQAEWPGRPVEQAELRVIRKIVNVIGGGLKNDDSARALRLFDSVKSRVSVSDLREEPVSQLHSEIATADMLHCTCHGLLKPHLLRIAKDTQRITNLAPSTIRALPIQTGSLVFANACSSAGVTVLFGKFNSFGWEFYAAGAAVFIGTLGAVPTKYAIEHAENIYTPLFNSPGPISIGQALTIARKQAEEKQNIFWLLYCVYGDPDYPVRFQ